MSRAQKCVAINACVQEEHLSAGEIADRLRAPSRNAVIGFAHRNKIKLMTPAGARAATRARRTGLNSKGTTRKASPSKRRPIVNKPAVRKARPKPKPIYKGPVDIMGLKDGVCRSPLWKDGLRRLRQRVRPEDAMFCGKPVKEGSSYCEDCHKKYYMKEPAKKSKTARNRGRRSGPGF